MSVTVQYQGRLGNHLFQYLAARLFAEENGLALETTFEHEAFQVEPHRPGFVGDEAGPLIGLREEAPILDRPYEPGRYILIGFFQRGRWYWHRRRRILEILKPRPIHPEPEDHVLAVVRLGDYWAHKVVIHPEWYDQVLSGMIFRKLTVVTDDPDSSYHQVFSKWDPRIRSMSAVDDFDLIRSFKTVVLGNTTFGWWAVFFGAARKIYTFAPWIRNPNVELSEFPGAIPVEGRLEHELVAF